MGIVDDYKRKLDLQLAERVFLDAQKDLVQGTLDRQRPISVMAKLVSIAVLATPGLMLALGVILIWSNSAYVGGWIFGGLFLALGAALVPRRQPLPKGVLRRDELPETFALLDHIAAKIGTDKITAVAIDAECNAYMAHIRGERVLGVGAILWQMLTIEERGAVLAHELAHQANGDPVRHGLTSRALSVLQEWLWYLEPDAGEFLTELIMYIPFLMVSALYRLLLRLVYLESQRAEYLADSIGARAAGASGLTSSLRKFSLADTRLSKEILGMHPSRAVGGVAMIDRLAASVVNTPVEERDAILAELKREKSTIDTSHPPTDHRIVFIDLLQDQSDPRIPTELLQRADQELQPYIAAMGDEILLELQRNQ